MQFQDSRNFRGKSSKKRVWGENLVPIAPVFSMFMHIERGVKWLADALSNLAFFQVLEYVGRLKIGPFKKTRK